MSRLRVVLVLFLSLIPVACGESEGPKPLEQTSPEPAESRATDGQDLADLLDGRTTQDCLRYLASRALRERAYELAAKLETLILDDAEGDERLWALWQRSLSYTFGGKPVEAHSDLNEIISSFPGSKLAELEIRDIRNLTQELVVLRPISPDKRAEALRYIGLPDIDDFEILMLHCAYKNRIHVSDGRYGHLDSAAFMLFDALMPAPICGGSQ